MGDTLPEYQLAVSATNTLSFRSAMRRGYTTSVMELRHLRYFVGVAEQGNLSKAATRLNVTQPALTRQIRDLEDELKRPLFIRQRRGVELTAAGRAILPHARKLLSDAAALASRGRSVSENPTAVKIAHSCAFDTEWIAPLLRPGSEYRVEMNEVMPLEAFSALRTGRAQAIVAVKPRRGLPAGTVGQELWRIQPLVALPANHRLARRRRIRLEDLAEERWGLWAPKPFPGYTDNFVESCRKAGFRPRVDRYITSLGDIFAHVMAGDFVSFTASVVRNLPHPGVSLVPIEWPFEQRPVVMLIWRKPSPLSSLFETLASRVASHCRGREG